MKRKNLLEIPPCQRRLKESEKVLAACQIVEIDGADILNIDLFYREMLCARYFASESESYHVAFAAGKWFYCYLNNVARICKGKDPITGHEYWCYDCDYIFLSDDEKKIALSYLRNYSIESWERGVEWEKKACALERKKERIRQMMDKVPCVSEEEEKWVSEDLFAGHILFFKRENRGQVRWQCTACCAEGTSKLKIKHGEQTHCPECGALVTANCRSTEKRDKKPVVILQQCGDEWVERQFTAICRWSKEGKELDLQENIRVLIPNGECYGKVWYGQETEADEFGQEFLDRNPLNKRFLSSYLYPGNLDKVLQCGRLEKSGLDILARKRIRVNVNLFILTFHSNPWYEYLIKAGLYRLATELLSTYGYWGNPGFMDFSGKSLQEVLRIDGNCVSRMKKVNGGINCLKWLQCEQDSGIKIQEEDLRWISDADICPDECRQILAELRSVKRMTNYIKKQKISPRNVTEMWRDYLRMAQEEGLDTTDDIVRLPRDLKARHDELVETLNARRDEARIAAQKSKYEKLDQQIAAVLPAVTRYFYEDEEYMIVPAARCEELMAEGRTLHHCVGSSDTYMNRMAAGTSWICFLRKKEELEKPYYTLEINMQDDSILQWYSEFDRKPDQEKISKVLEKYKRSIRRKRQQAQIVVA